MSSTNRGTERQKEDYYVTPLWCVRQFMHAWDECFVMPESVLDPCAGGDVYNPMSYPTVLQEWGVNDITTVDIREDSLATITGDYLQMNMTRKYDMIITNPPYTLAQDFIDRSFENLKPYGFLVMLLRLNFFGAQRRGEWWQTHLPNYAWVHSRRPSFFPDNWKEIMPEGTKKGTDSCEYAHFVWQKGKPVKATALRVIEDIRGTNDLPGPYYQEAA